MILLLAIACDDHDFTAGAAGEVVVGDSYSDVVKIFEGDCLSCHSAAAALGALDLETDACNALVNVPAAAYDGTLVIPGDSANSVLWHKVANTGTYGGQMPQGTSLSEESITTIADWIDAGASCDDAGTTPTGTTPTTPTVSDYSYQMMQETVLDAACTSCHFTGSTAGGGVDLSHAIDLVGLTSAEAGGAYGDIVLIDPGKPETSLIMLKVLGVQNVGPVNLGAPMPMYGDPLSTDQTVSLFGWILEGAL